MFGHPALLAEASVQKYVALEPLFPMAQPWQWLIVLVVVVGALVFISLMYVRDGVELPLATTLLLATLRVLALLGMLIVLLNPVLRSEKTIVKNSRLSVLIDTSLSMGLRDADSGSPSRIEQVVAELAHGSLISQLRREHDVVVYRFDQRAKPTQVASMPKRADVRSARDARQKASQRRRAALWQSRWIALAAAGLLACSLMLGGALVLARSALHATPAAPWLLLASVLLLVASVVVLAVADLRSSDLSLSAICGLRSATKAADAQQRLPARDPIAQDVKVDWKSELLPRGTETRLGDAVRYIVDKERGGPIAGILLFTDGRSNAGIDYRAAIAAAADAQIPIYAVGLGSPSRPVNVRVVDLQAPRRVYPGDKFTVTALLQSYGLKDRRVKVQLVSTSENDPDRIERFEDERTVRLAEDGKEISEKFQIEPQKDEGRRIYKLRVLPPKRDHDASDNERTATVEIVERKNRVLLVAGGPTREFRFLRSQLYRDDETELFVWLQSSGPGMAYAEGRETLLFDFPASEDELFRFDCLVAFDPDWRVLSERQTDLLERWISEKAGGMIVVAGPVYTPLWTGRPRGDRRIDTFRALYPVSFFSRGSATIKVGRFEGEHPWPIAFTREGRSAEFLWLEGTHEKSSRAWSQFDGVYGYYAVSEAKAGATVYARFSDPATAGGPNDELPIYLAGHFYGAGRVFFQGSGEMWRIRAVDEKYFERYYTKLIRWVSQGRLLRDSLRGVLLVDKDRCLLGDHIEVRAMLTDAQHLPLADDEVAAALIRPDSTRVTLTLRRVKNGAREGTFAGRFTALEQGDYRIVLAVPDSEIGQLLTREVRARLPDKEIERPERYDALLTDVANTTGGAYYVGIDQAMNRDGSGTAVYKAIAPQDQTTYLPGTPDKRFATKLMGWLLVFLCGTLASEWLIRRLSKLA